MRTIGSKYQIQGDVMCTSNGQPIPADEPLMLFRGRDRLLPALLDYYLQLRQQSGMTPEQLADLQAQVDAIKQWQASYPDRLKMPTK